MKITSCQVGLLCVLPRTLLPAMLFFVLVSCSAPRENNILLLVLDDFGYGDLAALRSTEASVEPLYTPNLDEFLVQSIGFTRHYTESTCAPSRAALLSGRYPARYGFSTNGRGLPPEITTLPEALSNAGYHTRFLGKWHTGDTTQLAYPHHQGFDSWLGFPNQWRLEERYDPGLNNHTRPTYMDPWLEDESGDQLQYEGHLNDILRDQALNFLTQQAQASAPWFLQMSFLAPHEPVMPSADYRARYPATPEGEYRALVEQLDAAIGSILDTLDELELADETIVVIVSDNGGTAMRYASNQPFDGEKWTYLEGGIRTPLMIRWPDGRLAGQRYPYAVTIMDLYPTLLASVGVDPPPENLDGRNLLPLLAVQERLPRELYWEGTTEEGYLFSVLDRSHRWRYSTGFFDSQWLFDLEANPNGDVDVLAANQAVADGLLDDYQRWHDDVHRVAVDFEALDQSGKGILTGDDFQRSPGLGDFTFAIGVTAPPDIETGGEAIIASQSQLLSITYAGETLRVSLQDARLTAPLPADGRCHAVILTARHAARSTALFGAAPIRSPIDLIIDSAVMDSLIDGREMPKDADLGAPTYIGHRPAGPGTPFAGRLSKPVVYNHRVNIEPVSGQIGIGALNDEVCPSG